MNLQELMMMRGGSPTGGMLPQGNNILPPQAGTEHLFPPFVNGIRPADMGVLNQSPTGGSLMNPMQPQPPQMPTQPSIQNRSMDMFNEMDSMPEGNYQQRIQRHGLSPVGPDELFRRMREQGAIGGLLDSRR